MENKKIIKEFLEKMAEQDNRCTAAPYFYVIKTKTTIQAPLDNCDYTRFYWQDSSYDSMDEILEYCKENDFSEEEIEAAEREAHEYGVQEVYEKKGMFLTEEDAENHLKNNQHHYSDDAYTYVNHAWRAPQLTVFFKALFEEFEIDQENWR